MNRLLVTRIAAFVFAAAALAEFAVGVAVLAFPREVTGFLLATPVEGPGLIVARLAGVAIAAMGLSWWPARKNLDRQLSSIAAGFLTYNIGVGLLFLWHALAAPRLVPVPWVVAVVHLLAGLAFAAYALLGRASKTGAD